MNFLDLSIRTVDNTLYTTLFRKPMERNTLLRYSSHHPRNLRDNPPYVQFLCLRRNCTHRVEYFQETDLLMSRLRERGYPNGLLKRSRKRAWYCLYETLLEVKPNSETSENRLVCVTTFNTRSNEIKKIINNHWDLIADELDESGKPLFAFKRGRKIKDFVVKSNLQAAPTPDLRSQLQLPPLVTLSVISAKLVHSRLKERTSHTLISSTFWNATQIVTQAMSFMPSFAHVINYMWVKHVRRLKWGSTNIAPESDVIQWARHWWITLADWNTQLRVYDGMVGSGENTTQSKRWRLVSHHVPERM